MRRTLALGGGVGSPSPLFLIIYVTRSVVVYCADEELLERVTDEDMGGLEFHVRSIFENDHPNLLSTYLESFAMFNHGFARISTRPMAATAAIDIFTTFQNFCNYLK